MALVAFEQLLDQGNHWIDRQEPRQAIPFFVQVLQADPNQTAALAGLAKATLQLGDPATAWQMLRAALAQAPDDPDILNAAGCIQLALGDASQARTAFNAALEHRPDDPGIQVNLATALCATGDLGPAEDVYRRLETDGQATATSRYNHALLSLLQGRLVEAWPGFELRRQALNTGMPERAMPGRRWDGSPRPGETLLVHAEQGLGDNIQFARYLPRVAAQVGRLILEVPPVLMDLFAGIPGVAERIALGDPLPVADCHAAVMSLPALCRTTLESIPAEVPYLTASGEAARRWMKRIGGGDGRLHVGLVWAGNAKHPRDRERSLPLATLAPAFAGRRDIALHAFQIGEPLDQVAAVAAEFGLDIDVLFPEPQALTEVAGALAAVDLLITVDTGLAHLAGALARPVWTLISWIPDWRWMLARSDTPWYPTMRLFRQPAAGDWAAVAANVGGALADLKI